MKAVGVWPVLYFMIGFREHRVKHVCPFLGGDGGQQAGIKQEGQRNIECI